MKKFLGLSLVFVFMFLMLGCGNSSGGKTSYHLNRDPDTLVFRLSADATVLNPVLSTDAYSSAIADWIYRGLVVYNEKFELEGDLAKSWQIKEEAVIYLNSPEANSVKDILQKSQLASNIEKVQVDSDTRLTVYLKKYDEDLDQKIRQIIPSAVLRPLTRVKVFFASPKVLEEQKFLNTGEKFSVAALVKKLKENKEKYRVAYASYLTRVSMEFLYEGKMDETSARQFLSQFVDVDKVLNKRVPPFRIMEKAVWNKPVLHFVLRDNLKWQDGVPITSADVKFTYEKIIDPKTRTVRGSMFRDVLDFRIINDKEFEVVYTKPYAPCISSWYMVVPKHIFENEPDFNNSKYNRMPVGSGPYRLVKWESDNYILLEAVDTYWRGKPPIKRIMYRILPNETSAYNLLLTQQLDDMGLTAYQWKFQTNVPQFINNYNKFKYSTPGYGYIGYNLDPQKCKLFLDKRVRQALSYAINRKGIIKALSYGLAKPCYSPIHPSSWAYNPNVKKYDYNPQKAKELLAEAGWKDVDGDGILEKNIDGKLVKFKFTLMTSASSDAIKKRAELIQANWKAIGVACDLKFVEWTVFLQKYVYPRNFEAIMLGWALGMDPDQYSIWASDQIEGGFNRIGYINPEVDKLLDAGRETFDKERRKKIYWKFQEIIAEDCPYTFLTIGDSLEAVHKRVVGVKATPLGVMYLRQLYKCHLDPKWTR